MKLYAINTLFLAALTIINLSTNINAYRAQPQRRASTLQWSGSILSRAGTSSDRTHWLSKDTFLRDSARCEAYARKIERNPITFASNPLFYFAGLLVRYINAILVGMFFSYFLVLNNRFVCHNKGALLKHVFRRKNCKPLLTVSNHLSVIDDPGLWAGIVPWWFMNPDSMRWVLCTEDVFFSSKFLSRVMALGSTMPLDRNGSILQGMFRAFFRKLSEGKWCHIYSEGKIWQRWRFDTVNGEDHLGPFKIGTGMLIAHCPITPIVVPMYHKGLDEIMPEIQLEDRKSKKRSVPVTLKPLKGKRIDAYFGDALDFSDKIQSFRNKYPGVLDRWGTMTIESINLYTEITREVRDSVLLLQRRAYAADERAPPLQEISAGYSRSEIFVATEENSNSNSREAFV